MNLTHTPLGLHVIGFTSLSAIIDIVFFKRDNKHCFRAVVAIPHEQRGIYYLYLPKGPRWADAFPETDPPAAAIYVKRRYKNVVTYYPPVWSFTTYYESNVAAGYSWVVTGANYSGTWTTYCLVGIPPSLWRPDRDAVLLLNTRYAVVEGEEDLIPQVADGNIESCTVLDSVLCDPVLSYSEEFLQINYDCRIPFRVTKDNILYLKLEHSLWFLAKPANTVSTYLLL